MAKSPIEGQITFFYARDLEATEQFDDEGTDYVVEIHHAERCFRRASR